MPIFQYTAKSMDGAMVKSTMEVANKEKLNERLRAEGLFLINYKEQRNNNRKYRIKAKELSEFCRQMGTMLASGVSLLRAMEIISQRDVKRALGNCYKQLVLSLEKGLPLSEAMSQQGSTFPPLLIHMFSAAEASGQMEKTAVKMSNHYQKEHRLKMRIRSASIYPIILLCITALVMVVIFTFVLPNFFDLYEGTVLPPITQFVMGMSSFITSYWYYIVVMVGAVVLIIKKVLEMPRPRYLFDKTKLSLPVFGKLMRTIYTARFSRTLSSLYASGLSIISALNVSRETVGNAYISSQFDAMIDQIREGVPLSGGIGIIDGFDIALASTIMIGEETGRLDEMLESAADSFDYEADVATQKLTSILEPLLIVTMGIIVGVIMVAVLLPIYDMYNSIGS